MWSAASVWILSFQADPTPALTHYSLESKPSNVFHRCRVSVQLVKHKEHALESPVSASLCESKELQMELKGVTVSTVMQSWPLEGVPCYTWPFESGGSGTMLLLTLLMGTFGSSESLMWLCERPALTEVRDERCPVMVQGFLVSAHWKLNASGGGRQVPGLFCPLWYR